MTLLCALGLIWRIWTDPQTQRQADRSPVIGSARATGQSPATGSTRATGTSPATGSTRATGTSPAVCPARITRRRDAGRVELPRLADARANPSAREHAPLAAVEAFAELPLSAWCAAEKVLRIRGGGGLGDAGVQPEHKSAPNRQPLLSPAPSDPYREVRGSASATSTSLPHTLERRGYTGTEEECSETESRPKLDTVDCAPDCVTLIAPMRQASPWSALNCEARLPLTCSHLYRLWPSLRPAARSPPPCSWPALRLPPPSAASSARLQHVLLLLLSCLSSTGWRSKDGSCAPDRPSRRDARRRGFVGSASIHAANMLLLLLSCLGGTG